MSLPRSAPRDQAADATGVLTLLDAAEEQGIDLHSLMVVRRGHVVAEGWWTPYAATRPHLAYSLSKTLTATAIGFLAQEGRLGLDDPVLDLLPPEVRGRAAPGWEAVLVRHCLSMTVGHDTDVWHDLGLRGGTAPTDDWLTRVLATRLDHAPGTQFTYDQVATYVLSRVVAHVTGEGVLDVLRPRLLRPLGLPEDVPWHRDPGGHELGFSGAHLTTEAIASVGQLYLDGGAWRGEQLLDPAWVAEATRGQGPLNNRDPGAGPDWLRGYGFSFWQQRGGYRGDGAFGQLMVVLPEHDVVVATTASTTAMQALVDLVRDHLVPALDAPGSAEADERLARRLAGLAVPAPAAAGSAPVERVEAARADGGGDTDLHPAYDRVVVADGELSLHRDGRWYAVPLGDGGWAESTWHRETDRGTWSLPVAASGGWRDEHRFSAEVLVVETAHRLTVDVRRDGAGRAEASLRWRDVPLNGSDPWDSAARRGA